MDKTVLKTLEYYKIRELLMNCTTCSLGRELAEELIPVNAQEEVESRLDETREARAILDAMPGSVPLGGIRDIRSLVKRAQVGALLEPHDLVAVSSTLYATRRMKNFFMDMPEDLQILRQYAAELTVLRNLEQSIENIVTEQGTLRDDASPELKQIRRDIRTSQLRVKEKLDSILRSQDNQKYFQDALVTMRGDRYVIPIKQEARYHFPGIIHDQSASGATVFIEPMAVVTLNNEIKQLMLEEKNEIERILKAIAAQVGRYGEELYENCRVLAQFDLAFAKGKLSQDMRAVQPQVNSDGYVNLRQARHPLIPKEVVVPIDIYIGRDFNTLLITGPNTGGKTVSLKTLGLFVLMAQSGLYIPAESGSELAIFNEVFADIGDEQSIEQSLSTFSAHMTNLVRILQRVSAQDLVLIDEIGSGTDPDEGAALAVAILERLLAVGARTIATTHYSELKSFAYSRTCIENASVEFDIQTLRPTYRLLIGVPGSSNAFAISRRLGLDEDIIEQAKGFIDKDHAEFETMLNRLEEQKISCDHLQEELQQQRQEVTAMQIKLAEEQEALAKAKQRILVKARSDAETLLRNSRREAEQVIAELKAQFTENSGAKRQTAINKNRQRLRDNIQKLQGEDDGQDHLPPVNSQQLLPGMMVYVATLKQKGTVLSLQGNEATVQLGIMKMNVKLNDCRLLEGQETKTVPTAKGTMNFSKVCDVSREIDLRGMMVEEAELVLDKYIDDAILAGLTRIIVIHGKGTGALRKGVRSYLKHHRYVRDISIGELTEGGDGATVVNLM